MPVSKVITCPLSSVAEGNHNDVDSHAGKFFRHARRSGLWLDVPAIHRSARTNARKKVPWQGFQGTLTDAVQGVDDLWPEKPQYPWHGMAGCAPDGSKYTRPATKPCARSVTRTAVLRRPTQAIIRVVSVNSSEREEAAKLLSTVPEKSVWLFDRGYPSSELFRLVTRKFNGDFVYRCPARGTFPASVLITNLLNHLTFPRNDIIALSCRPWE